MFRQTHMVTHGILLTLYYHVSTSESKLTTDRLLTVSHHWNAMG